MNESKLSRSLRVLSISTAFALALAFALVDFIVKSVTNRPLPSKALRMYEMDCSIVSRKVVFQPGLNVEAGTCLVLVEFVVTEDFDVGKLFAENGNE